MGFLKDEHESIYNELSSTNPLPLENVTSGSGLVLLWLCPKGHEYEARVFNRVKGSGCPYCAGQKPLPGVNDLATVFPNIFSYVDDKTLVILPFSNKQITWKCELGHITVQSPKTYCSEGKFSCAECPKLPKVALTSNEKLAGEYSSNNPVPANLISLNSNKKVLWVCDKGHEWASPPKNRKLGRGCPQCFGRKTQKLPVSHPELVKQWADEDNKAENFTAGSAKQVKWRCEKGHSFTARIDSRINRKTDKVKPCPVCLNKIVVPKVNTLDITHPNLLDGLVDQKAASSVTYGSEKQLTWRCNEGHEYTTQVRSRATKGTGCPHCVTSQAEQTLASYVESLGVGSLVKNTRKVIPPFELDIYIPEKNMAIEFNGVYWHSEAAGKDKWYHHNKWETAKKKGIQLIQIWEDEWNRNPEQVKRMLAHKLGVVSGKRVYARKTQVVELSKKQMDVFLDENHIQGAVDGGVRLGLVSDDVLVAAMLLKTEAGSEGKSLNLLRFATAVPVPGGFTKLIKVTRELFPEVTQVVTFSDNCVSDGGLYESNGFVAEKQLDPDYRYVVKGVREHKFNYRLKRFRNDPELQYVEGLSESQLAKLNNLPRIWDCGKTKWVLYW